MLPSGSRRAIRNGTLGSGARPVGKVTCNGPAPERPGGSAGPRHTARRCSGAEATWAKPVCAAGPSRSRSCHPQRADPCTTKNDKGRVVYLTSEFRGILVAQVERVKEIER